MHTDKNKQTNKTGLKDVLDLLFADLIVMMQSEYN